jgi:nitrite reductase (NADH) small subunit
MTEWKVICKVDDIPVLGARRVQRAKGVEVAVFALLDQCPHKRGPLSQGLVFGETVVCPLHNWHIGLVDGCAHAPDVGCTTRFAVRVENGDVALDVNELNTLAIDDATVTN